MDFPEWGKYILAGAAAWLGKYGLDYWKAALSAKSTANVESRKMNLDEFSIIRQAMNEDFQAFRDQIAKQDKIIERQELKIQRQDEKIEDLIRKDERQRLALEAADKRLQFIEKEFLEYKVKVPDLPFPAWIKSPEGIMMGLNNAYEQAFLRPKGFRRVDYVGHDDEKIWGGKVATTFRRNDQKAIKSEQGVFIEIDDDHEILKPWTFYKYPRFSDGVLVGIAGIGLPTGRMKP
jgi:hypothetical protein